MQSHSYVLNQIVNLQVHEKTIVQPLELEVIQSWNCIFLNKLVSERISLDPVQVTKWSHPTSMSSNSSSALFALKHEKWDMGLQVDAGLWISVGLRRILGVEAGLEGADHCLAEPCVGLIWCCSSSGDTGLSDCVENGFQFLNVSLTAWLMS